MIANIGDYLTLPKFLSDEERAGIINTKKEQLLHAATHQAKQDYVHSVCISKVVQEHENSETHEVIVGYVLAYTDPLACKEFGDLWYNPNVDAKRQVIQIPEPNSGRLTLRNTSYSIITFEPATVVFYGYDDEVTEIPHLWKLRGITA